MAKNDDEDWGPLFGAPGNFAEGRKDGKISAFFLDEKRPKEEPPKKKRGVFIRKKKK